MESKKREIVKIIKNMSGRYSTSDIFTDWVAMLALSIQNNIYLVHNRIWQQREQQYIDIVKKYSKEELNQMVKMSGLLTIAVEKRMSDILGEIYMESGCGNKNTGQFFTPYNLSFSVAQTSLPLDINEENPISIYEPSVGGGGMIIAAAQVLRDRGLNYRKCLRVTAQDLDWKGVYMSYVQFSLLGINAEVVQGDTLCDPYRPNNYPEERIFRTPRRMGVLL